MTDEHAADQEHGLLGALLAPLRAPQRMVTDIETIASALVSVGDRLASVDKSAGVLVSSVGALQAPVEQIDRKITKLHKELVQVITQRMNALQEPLDRVDLKVTELATLEQVIKERMLALQEPLDRVDLKVTELSTIEQAVTERMDAIHSDLNARMLKVEQEVHALHPPIGQMAADVANVVTMLPNPEDSALTRLKDTFTSSD